MLAVAMPKRKRVLESFTLATKCFDWMGMCHFHSKLIWSAVLPCLQKGDKQTYKVNITVTSHWDCLFYCGFCPPSFPSLLLAQTWCLGHGPSLFTCSFILGLFLCRMRLDIATSMHPPSCKDQITNPYWWSIDNESLTCDGNFSNAPPPSLVV